MATDLSIIVRSMDRDLLARSLGSIAIQRFANAEVLVVNARGRVHRALPARCGPHALRLVDAGRPLGRADAANAGLDAAAGERLCFLDDDDEMMEGGLATLARVLDEHPGCGLAHARSIVLDAWGRELTVVGGPYRKELRLEWGFISPGQVMFRRSLLEAGARFDPALDVLEDMEFFIQCSELTRFAFRPEAVHRYWSGDGTSGIGDPAAITRALGYIAGKWRRGLRAMP